MVKMDETIELVVTIIIVLLALFTLIVLPTIAYIEWKNIAEYKANCEAKGGKAVTTKHGKYCFKKELFVEKDDV